MDNIDNMNQYGTTQQESNDTLAHDKGAGVRTYRPNRPSSGGGHKGYKDASPEEIQKLVSERVAKAVAAAAGAVEGFATQMRESKLVDNTRDAIEQVGQTASTIAGTTREQFQNTRKAISGGSGGFGKSGSLGGQEGTEAEGGQATLEDSNSSGVGF